MAAATRAGSTRCAGSPRRCWRGLSGPGLVVDDHGWVAAVTGMPSLERVAVPRAERPVAIHGVGVCVPEPVPGGWLLRASAAAALRLTLELDPRPPRAVVDGSNRWLHPLSTRHAEVLLLLAHAGATGMDAAALSAALYGDREHLVTVRAEMSRLRRSLGGLLLARPYRLAPHVDVVLPDLATSTVRPRLDRTGSPRPYGVTGPAEGESPFSSRRVSISTTAAAPEIRDSPSWKRGLAVTRMGLAGSGAACNHGATLVRACRAGEPRHVTQNGLPAGSLPVVPGSALGIVANPMSGRDIRRLVAQASVFPNAEKTNMVLRLIAAAGATGVETVLMSTDAMGVAGGVVRARDRRRSGAPRWPSVEFVELDALTGTAEDTRSLVAAMRRRGAGVIVLLGGDGTVRAASATSGDVPLLPLSTGTNNAFPEMWEATVAGTAAGLLATGRAGDDATYRAKVLRVDGRADAEIALVDVCVSTVAHVGSKALWQPGTLREVYCAFAEPHAIGLSSIAGLVHPGPAAIPTASSSASPRPGRALDSAGPDRARAWSAGGRPRGRPAARRRTPHDRGRARHGRGRRRTRDRVRARHPRHRHLAHDGPRVLDVRRPGGRRTASGCSSRRPRST